MPMYECFLCDEPLNSGNPFIAASECRLGISWSVMIASTRTMTGSCQRLIPIWPST